MLSLLLWHCWNGLTHNQAGPGAYDIHSKTEQLLNTHYPENLTGLLTVFIILFAFHQHSVVYWFLCTFQTGPLKPWSLSPPVEIKWRCNPLVLPHKSAHQPSE